MILLIKSGNTMTNFAIAQDGKIMCTFHCHNNLFWTSDEYYSWLAPLLDARNIPFSSLTYCVIASVVPEAFYNLTQFAKAHFQNRFATLSALHPKLGLSILIDNPAGVGSDLLANAIGAWEHYGRKPAVIIDCGTATTSTLIDHDGNFIGALIAPGFKTSLLALCQNGAQLPVMSFKKPQAVIGKNTFDAINAGMYFGHSGMVSNLAKVSRNYLHEKLDIPFADIQIIGTGGYINNIESEEISIIDEELLFKGLWVFYNRVEP
jgi:type III pantothenate kinase